MLFPQSSILSKGNEYLKTKKKKPPKPTSINTDLSARRLQRDSVFSSSLHKAGDATKGASDTQAQGMIQTMSPVWLDGL